MGPSVEVNRYRDHPIGVNNAMWGNDFAHPERTWPHTKKWLLDTFTDIRSMRLAPCWGSPQLTSNNFDKEALAEHAIRIGPTPEDPGPITRVARTGSTAVRAPLGIRTRNLRIKSPLLCR